MGEESDGRQMARKTSILFILPRQHKAPWVIARGADVRFGSLHVSREAEARG